MALAGSDGVNDHASPDGASPLFSIRGGPRRPADDGPHTAPRVLAVRDGREAPAQFGHGGQLAALVPGVADRSRGLLVHDEHAGSLRKHAVRTRWLPCRAAWLSGMGWA